METRDRSSSPDSPQRGYGLGDWLESPRSIAVTAIGIFILILGIAILLGYRHFEATRDNALTADKTTANLLADFILEHNRATIGILQSYATRPAFITAAKNKDRAGAYKRLSVLKKNTEIDLTFVTDKRGVLWANFPFSPESIGKDLSYRDWYKGISSHWKPYISTVFKLIVGDKPLAVAVCVPIFDEKGRPIGILGSSQRLHFLADDIEQVPFGPYTVVSVIDRAGQILYSNKVRYQENMTAYPFIQIVAAALTEKRRQIEMNDPQQDQEKRYLTVVPVRDIGWTVIIETSRRDIYRAEFKSFIVTGAFSFLLFFLIIFMLNHMKKNVLLRKTEDLLHAETKLRQEEEKLRVLSSRQEAILAAVPAIIMEVDHNKVYTWANSVGIEFFGADVIGKEAAFYFEGEQDTYDTVMPLFNGAEDIIYVESWQRRRDGEKRLLVWWCRALKDEKGNVAGALSSAYDSTERKREEAALKESERVKSDILEKLNESQHIALIGSWEWNLKTDHVWWSDETYRIFGVTPQDFVPSFEANGKFIHPDDFAMYGQLFEHSLQTGEPLNYACRLVTHDGRLKYCQVSGKVIYNDSGRPIRFIGTIMDITDRKQAEAQVLRQSQLLAAINRIFYETLTAADAETVVQVCLTVAQELTGSQFGFIGEITPDGLFTMTALSDPGWEACRMPGTQAATLIKDMVVRGIWGQVILNDRSLIVNEPLSFPERVGIPEGHPPITSFLGVPLKKNDKVIGMIAMANRESGYLPEHQQDLEALAMAFLEALSRKQSEAAVRTLNEELEQRIADRTAQLKISNKELEAFSYSVAHDLRAPLRSIDGFSQTLLEEYQDKPMDSTGKNYLERVSKAARHMGFLIDDLLKLARVSQSECRQQSVDLSHLFKTLVEAIRQSAPGRKVEVVVQEGIIAQCDPYLVQIALTNLLDNAWKFTGKEENPRIEFGRMVQDGTMACFVRDNGAGFDMAYADKLFGAFQRLHNKEEFPGTGIGLATVKRIVARHGGHVWAEGAVGKGATFYFTLQGMQ